MDYIAFQYAEAMFQLAMEEETVEQTLEDFQELVAALNTEFYMYMEHPNMKKKEKRDLIEKIVPTPLIKHLCFVLVENQRMRLLPDVLEEYVGLINQKEQVMDVDVFTKTPLTKEESKKLVDSLEERFHKKVRLHNTVDEGIIGGVRLEYNGAVLDDTINHYFKALQARLTK